jgi:HK97 family phage portal protein
MAQPREANGRFAASPQWSIGDPALAEWLRMNNITTGEVTETQALGLTALYRCVALISGVVASLPLKVYRDLGDGARERVPHFLSTNPAGPYDLSAFSWVEMVMLHLLLNNEAFLKSVVTEGGELVGLWPIHPAAVNKVSWDGADKVFEVSMQGGKVEKYITGEVVHVLGMSTDGTRGIPPLTTLREALQTARAGNTASNASFTSGALISGLVTTEEDVDEEEAKIINDKLKAKTAGAEHAGDIAFVNRSLKFQPWRMSAVDAQFAESRNMSVEDIARIFGMPLSALSVGGAVSNWGTGVSESFLGLQRYVLTGWTSRLESALRAILPVDEFAEFDYKGLLQGSPKDEIALLIEQVNAGILTKDEARAIMNLAPLPAGSVPTPDASNGMSPNMPPPDMNGDA